VAPVPRDGEWPTSRQPGSSSVADFERNEALAPARATRHVRGERSSYRRVTRTSKKTVASGLSSKDPLHETGSP